jgi:competence ComEA-like helix-hairpin-helix protein
MFNQLLNSIRKYFGISRTEANGVIILLLLMFIIIISPLFYSSLLKGGYSSYQADSVKLDSILQVFKRNLKSQRVASENAYIIRDTLFSFNPNEIPYQKMLLLGFDTILARRVVKFRNSNGRFYKKKDLLKIYDLPEILYARLADYIVLPDSEIHAKLQNRNQTVFKADPAGKKDIEIALMNINIADTNELKKISGVGSVLSRRIIKYRDLLGGYSNINQLNDVYGLNGKSLSNLKSVAYIDTLFTPERIRINFSEWKDLVQHPYINSRLANDILYLRSNVGFLEGIKDLKNISYLNDSILYRLEPYFEF